MLQGPKENSTTEDNQLNQDSTPTTQHGVRDSDTLLSPQPLVGEGRASDRQTAVSNEVGDVVAGSSTQQIDANNRGLSQSRRRTGSPVDKIMEHEDAQVKTSTKRRELPTFALVSRGRKKASGNQTELSHLSNEILTHILSHLPPVSLSEIALVSKRFHELVTTPHAWRVAFNRYFPGPEVLNALDSNSELSDDTDTIRVERRLFTRLTPLASWRSEYILRTRLLRALARGKPNDFDNDHRSKTSKSGSSSVPVAQVTYNTNLVGPVTHLHANFGAALNKKSPRLIHGADEYGGACTSDPREGKVDSWGFLDSLPHRQFADLFPGDAMYGLGTGDVVGVPNVMDVSQTYGMVYGEGLIAGTLWYRSLEEKRGRALTWTTGVNQPELGIPALQDNYVICSVWIAKSNATPGISDDQLGILSGSSTGVLTAYSLGTSGLRDRRLERGQITARWILSPGVPIVGISVDENFSEKRHLDRRVWAVVLNALGEVFYLDELPAQLDNMDSKATNRLSRTSQLQQEKSAWLTGRSVHWSLMEPTRRVAKPDTFNKSGVDGSYTPRSSWDKMCLTQEQLIAETKEITSFLRKKPKDFQKICYGWDMQRRLEVDFAASDEYGTGETICVIKCGLDDEQPAEIKRLTRCRLIEDLSSEPFGAPGSTETNVVDAPTIFGDGAANTSNNQSSSTFDEWRTSLFNFGSLKTPQITSTALDASTWATITTKEDPLLSTSPCSQGASPLSSPAGLKSKGGAEQDIPGQKARLLAVGSKNGTIFVWNMRAPTSHNSFVENSIRPLRIIYTESPQISCLALTALYLVHGGNDGLVQAWDPLASTTEPIRTLNSRFSSRARRRLIQAEASPAGVGLNLFAAGAISLDPDPTVLRGVVSLGSHLRYWSYSSLSAEQYKGKKRRPRRFERNSNQGGDKFSGTGRGALMEYIANEKLELEREKRNKRKEEERLAGRFGLDLLGPGASEDEILAYATMLSEEALQQDETRRRSPSNDSQSSATITEDAVSSPMSSINANINVDEDRQMAEALQLSLQESSSTSTGDAPFASASIPVKYGKNVRSPDNSPRRKSASSADEGAAQQSSAEADDLQYALQLSLAEERSLQEDDVGWTTATKGKDRAR